MLNIFKRFRKEEVEEVVVVTDVTVIDKDGNEIVIDNEEVIEEIVIDNEEENEEAVEENNEKETIKERIEKQYKTYKENLVSKFNKFKITMKKLGILVMMGMLVILYRIEKIFKKIETLVDSHIKKMEEKAEKISNKYEG